MSDRKVPMDELSRLYERLDRGFDQINARLDVMNGRVREAETDIAVLNVAKGQGHGIAAAVGGGLGGVVVAVAEAARWFFGR